MLNKDRKKVVIVVPHLGRSGPTQQLTYLLSGISEDFDIEILGIQPEKKENLRSEIEKYRVKVSLSSYYNFLFLWARLVVLRFLGQVDIFHSHGLLPDLLCGLLLPRKKWVSVARNFPPHDYVQKFGNFRGRIFGKLHLNIHKKCTNLVACSYSLSKAYRRVGISAKPIRNAVRFPHATELNYERNHKSRFVFVGNINSRKRVNLTCRFFEMLQEGSYELDIIGDGVELHNVKKAFEHNSKIHFHGRQTNVWPYLLRAKILINLSSSEGLPNAVLEGIAAGCNCILSDIEPHREIRDCIGNGVITLMVSEKSTDQELYVLASYVREKIKLFSEQKHEINQSAANKIFGIDRLASQFSDYYEGVTK